MKSFLQEEKVINKIATEEKSFFCFAQKPLEVGGAIEQVSEFLIIKLAASRVCLAHFSHLSALAM